MIYLDFDATALPPRQADGLTAAGQPWNAFHFVPVLLHIAGIDLLSDNADADGSTVADGLGLPLPEIALWGLIALHQVAREGISACELNEHGVALLFAMKDDFLLVHSMRRERTVQVPYPRLLTAWEEFDVRVRRFLVQTFGRLTDYPWWSPSMDRWLNGTWPLAGERASPASMHYLSACKDAFIRVDAVEE
jgi:hypothetical protein